MQYPYALQSFKEMIDRMHSDLLKYADKDDASDKYIALINSRIKVCDTFLEAAEAEIKQTGQAYQETNKTLLDRIAFLETIIKNLNLVVDGAHVDPYYVSLAMYNKKQLLEQWHQWHLENCDHHHHDFYRKQYLKDSNSDYSVIKRVRSILDKQYGTQKSS